MPNTDPNITSLIESFARQIAAAVEASAVERIQTALTSAFGAPAKRRPGRPSKAAAGAVTAPPTKKPKKASPKVARARKLQGQYLGALRSLTAGDRAKVKSMAKDQGVAAAVKLALSLKKKA